MLQYLGVAVPECGVICFQRYEQGALGFDVGRLRRQVSGEIAKVVLDAKLAPTGINFVRAFHTIQHEMMWAAVTPAYAKLPACIKCLRNRLKALPNEKRPGRACDRVVKSRPQRYTV